MHIQHLSKDIIFKPVIESIILPDLSGSTDVYLALLESILSQQLSVKVSDIIFQRFLNLFKNKFPDPNNVIEIEVEKLRSVGLSYQKAVYIKNVAEFALKQGMEWDTLEIMDDDEN